MPNSICVKWNNIGFAGAKESVVTKLGLRESVSTCSAFGRYLGAQVEINARYEGIFIHPVLLAMHVVYMGLFSVEIFIRCAAVGPVAYVCGSGWAWHWLDMVAAA